jgi:hypothetical protein
MVLAILALVCFSAIASAQVRQTALYIDDGHGAFSTLTAPLGGGAITLPGASITFPTTNGNGVLTNDGAGNLSWTALPPMGVLFQPAYFNYYTTSFPLSIPPGVVVPVTTFAINTGFTSDGSGGFTVQAAGIYNIEFSISPQSSAAFAIFVNSIAAQNSEFGCSTGTTVIHGNAILSLNALDKIQLANVGFTTVSLASAFPGTVTASLSAIRIQ